MKLQLWMLNGTLVVMFILAATLNYLFKQEPPIVQIRPVFIGQEEKKPEAAQVVPITTWEKIYQNDVFNTYDAPQKTAEKVSFVTPIPEPPVIAFTPPPEPTPINFLPPLPLTVKGIIVTADEKNSVVMIADETGKERMYHLLDRVKDAEVIKISRNKVVLLRSNGQSESYYLIKDDLTTQAPDRWNNIVKKTDDQNYQIDPYSFKEEVLTLGNLIERAGIIGLAYSQGSPIGIKIGDTKNCDVATNLGLIQNDIIRTINEIETADSKNRIKIYNLITKMNIGDKISINLMRSGQNISLVYNLSKLERIFKKPLPTGIQESKDLQNLPMNQMQEREKHIRDFSKLHEKDNGMPEVSNES